MLRNAKCWQEQQLLVHWPPDCVLDQGKIVGKGTHDELMESSEVYREIAQSQLSMEELAS